MNARFGSAVAVGIAVMIGMTGAHADDAGQNTCIQLLAGGELAPTIDGRIANDEGWSRALRLELDARQVQCLDSGQKATARLVATSQYLFVGVSVPAQNAAGTPCLHDTSSILLGFDSVTNLVATDAGQLQSISTTWKLNIKPNTSGQQSTGKYILNNGAEQHADMSAWFLNPANMRKTEADGVWNVELRIPRVSGAPDVGAGVQFGLFLPTFKMYLNIMTSEPVPDEYWAQFAYPASITINPGGNTFAGFGTPSSWQPMEISTETDHCKADCCPSRSTGSGPRSGMGGFVCVAGLVTLVLRRMGVGPFSRGPRD